LSSSYRKMTWNIKCVRKRTIHTIRSQMKAGKLCFLKLRLFWRCKCPSCHDSATIYLQFNSIVKSNVTIYCQLEGKKMGNSVSREGFCSLAHLLVLKLNCFSQRVCLGVCSSPMFFPLIWIAWGHGIIEWFHSWTADDAWQSCNALPRKLAQRAVLYQRGFW
jgi:hypothetical protein